MKILHIMNLEQGWDSTVTIADSLEAAAFEMELNSVKELKEYLASDYIHYEWLELATLPKDCSTLKEAQDKYWS